jgi:peptidoglycan/xylan/chitin deacetylase (PgdA/CDA1 family)
LFIFLLWSPSAEGKSKQSTPPSLKIPILLYHRFGPTVADSMTVTTSVFESHLRYLHEKGYKVIPLRQLVDYYLKKGPPPPPRSVVIVADDGHKTVFTDMFPLVKKYRIPVTLFIYPSAISHASYAMTWDQVKELKKSGFFDFQSHSYWHPNFNRDKKRLKPSEYAASVDMQLKKSKEKIEKEVGNRVDMIAWPFGIYNDELIKKAMEAGYVAAFTIQRHHAGTSDKVMTLPRYIMEDSYRGNIFERILNNE